MRCRWNMKSASGTAGFTRATTPGAKRLGENELGSTQYYDNQYRNPLNRGFDKRIMTFNRTHVFKSNGIYDLPFGKGKMMLSNANRLVDGVLGGWRLSGILTITSGVPFTVTAPDATFTQFTTGNTPDVTGALSKGTGQLQYRWPGRLLLLRLEADPRSEYRPAHPGSCRVRAPCSRK